MKRATAHHANLTFICVLSCVYVCVKEVESKEKDFTSIKHSSDLHILEGTLNWKSKNIIKHSPLKLLLTQMELLTIAEPFFRALQQFIGGFVNYHRIYSKPDYTCVVLKMAEIMKIMC